MNAIQLVLNEKQHGAFLINGEKGETGEMVFGVRLNELVVFHTEVSENARGKGFGKKLLNALVAYAKEEGLSLFPMCSYVRAQLEKSPEDYKEVWTPAVNV